MNDLIKDPLIDKGEAEALILALENNISWLITDDLKSIQILNTCNESRVKIRSSILIPVILKFSGKIPKRQAKQAIIQIAKHQKWNQALFRESLELLDKFKK